MGGMEENLKQAQSQAKNAQADLRKAREEAERKAREEAQGAKRRKDEELVAANKRVKCLENDLAAVTEEKQNHAAISELRRVASYYAAKNGASSSSSGGGSSSSGGGGGGGVGKVLDVVAKPVTAPIKFLGNIGKGIGKIFGL